MGRGALGPDNAGGDVRPMVMASPLTIAAAALLLGGGAASAQASAFVSAGAVVPLQDFATVARTGPAVAAGVVFETGVPRLTAGVEGAYGWADHTFGDARSDLYALMGVAAYTLSGFGSLELRPLGGLGVLAHARRSADFPGLDATRAGLGGMVGLRAAIPIGGVHAFVSGSYLRGLGGMHSGAFPTQLALVTAGVTLR